MKSSKTEKGSLDLIDGNLLLALTFDFARTYHNVKPQQLTWQYVYYLNLSKYAISNELYPPPPPAMLGGQASASPLCRSVMGENQWMF